MEEYTIPQDINAMYVQATSFPNGVKSTHEKIHSLAAGNSKRKYFGISYPNPDGTINYKAAAEELYADEAASQGLEIFTIRKGKYITELLKDWMKQEGKIGETFRQLLKHPGIAKDGYCLEEYINDTDILLMVTLE